MSFRSLYRHGFARVAACTTRTALADPATNAETILRMARACDRQAVAVAVFPELGLSGYSISDLLQQVVLLDAVGRPDASAGLRRSGAVGPGTRLVALHLSHDAPGGAGGCRALAAQGVEVLPDGARVAGDASSTGMPRRTLVLGGARSGKSAEAERRLAAFPDVVYVATGGTRAGDPEWARRVRLHRERRPASWRTEETCDLVPLLASEGPPLLVDCLALWLTAAMDAVGAWDDDRWAEDGERELAARTAELAAAWRSARRPVVAVSNEVGSGVVPATASGRRFRDALGRLNAAIAAESEQVLLVVAGTVLPLRG